MKDTGNRKIEKARREGFVLGLKMSYKMLRDAKNYQSRQEQEITEAGAALKADFAHGASVLHGLCLKLADEIKKAGAQ